MSVLIGTVEWLTIALILYGLACWVPKVRRLWSRRQLFYGAVQVFTIVGLISVGALLSSGTDRPANAPFVANTRSGAVSTWLYTGGLFLLVRAVLGFAYWFMTMYITPIRSSLGVWALRSIVLFACIKNISESTVVNSDFILGVYGGLFLDITVEGFTYLKRWSNVGSRTGSAPKVAPTGPTQSAPAPEGASSRPAEGRPFELLVLLLVALVRRGER